MEQNDTTQTTENDTVQHAQPSYPVEEQQAPASLQPTILHRLGLDSTMIAPNTEFDELVESLRHEEWSRRVAAAKALGKQNDPAAREVLLTALHDAHGAVRATAIRALGNLASPLPIKVLTTLLHDSEWTVRIAIVRVLGKRGGYLAGGVLVEALEDEHEQVREAARQELKRFFSQKTALFNVEEPAQSVTLPDEKLLPVRSELNRETPVADDIIASITYLTPKKTYLPVENRSIPMQQSPVVPREPQPRSLETHRVQKSGHKPLQLWFSISVLLILLTLVSSAVAWTLINNNKPKQPPATAVTPTATPQQSPTPVATVTSGPEPTATAPAATSIPVPPTTTVQTPLPPVILPGSVLLNYTGHNGAGVKTAAWSPDGKWVATGSRDKTVQVWNPDTGEIKITYRGHTNEIYRLAWSPDGTRIVSVSDSTMHIWEIATGNTIHTYSTKGEHFRGVAWSSDGKTIVASSMSFHDGSVPGTTYALNAETAEEIHVVHRDFGQMYGIALSPDGKQITVITSNIKVMDLDGSNERIIDDSEGFSITAAWSPDGKYLAYGHDKSVRVWDMSTGQVVRTYLGHTDSYVVSVAWSPDGKKIASGLSSGVVHIWDAFNEAQSLIMNQPPDVGTGDIAWSLDGQRVVIVTDGQKGFVQIRQVTPRSAK